MLLGDREARPGSKFKDADQIGIPLRIVVNGKGIKAGLVELKWRTDAQPAKIPVANAVSTVLKMLADRRAEENKNVPAPATR